MTTESIRIGIDVGGTFNDFVLVHGADSRLSYYKEPSVPTDPSLAVERGIAGLLREAGIEPAAVKQIVHGTTLGLNAIIQRRGAAMALIVSRGNRDVLEIARSRMPAAYDFAGSREVPLVPRDLVFEIDARQRADGTVVQSPEIDELDELANRLRLSGVKAVAIMLLNSYRHPEMERLVAAELRDRLPGVLITESAAISPEMREYERALLAGLNAYIHPLMASYFDRLEARLAGLGISAPLYITANNGGTVSLATARERPVDTILSGPASGVVAAVRVLPQDDRARLITLDMGGTSTDMAVVQDSQPEFTMQAKVGDFPLILPVVSVTAIGAGGGSIVWRDAQGVLKIGPESAGADPGPACYGLGAKRPAITDCYLVTGILDPDNFLGGRLRLNVPAAEAALAPIADGLTFDGPDRIAAAAAAALRIATAKMAVELRKLLARRGLDPADFTLVSYGGAGATHACLLAAEAGVQRAVVPLAPGTFCALGAVLADVRRDYARSMSHMLAQGNSAPVAAAIGEMRSEATAWIAEQGAVVDVELKVVADMRYSTQAFDLAVDVPAALAAKPDAAALAALFHDEHRRLYGFANADAPVRVSTVRLSVIGVREPVDIRPAMHGEAGAARMRRVYHDDAWHDVPVRTRAALGPGEQFAGPALIEQRDTTIWILPGWSAQSDQNGNLVLSRA